MGNHSCLYVPRVWSKKIPAGWDWLSWTSTKHLQSAPCCSPVFSGVSCSKGGHGHGHKIEFSNYQGILEHKILVVVSESPGVWGDHRIPPLRCARMRFALWAHIHFCCCYLESKLPLGVMLRAKAQLGWGFHLFGAAVTFLSCSVPGLHQPVRVPGDVCPDDVWWQDLHAGAAQGDHEGAEGAAR